MLKQSLQRDFTLVLCGQIVTALATLGSLSVWTSYLSPTQVGILGLTAGVSSVLTGVFISPILSSILVHFADTKETDLSGNYRRSALRLVRLVRSLILLAILLVALVALILESDTVLYMPILACLFIFDVRRNFEITLFAAARRHKSAMFLSAGDACARFIAVWVTFAWIEQSALSALSGLALGSAAFCLIAISLLDLEDEKSSEQEGVEFSKLIQKKILFTSIPLVPAAILANISDLGNRYIVGFTLTLADSALFFVAYGLVKRPFGMAAGATDWTFRPAMLNALSIKEKHGISRIRNIWLTTGITIASFGVLGFFFLGDWIVGFILGGQFEQAKTLIFPLAIGVALFNVANIYSNFSLTLKNTKMVFVNNLSGCICHISLTFLFSYWYGILGAAIAFAVSYFLQTIVSNITYRISARKNETFDEYLSN